MPRLPAIDGVEVRRRRGVGGHHSREIVSYPSLRRGGRSPAGLISLLMGCYGGRIHGSRTQRGLWSRRKVDGISRNGGADTILSQRGLPTELPKVWRSPTIRRKRNRIFFYSSLHCYR